LKIALEWKEKQMHKIALPLGIAVAIFGLLSCSTGKIDQAKRSEAGTSPAEFPTSEVVIFDNLGGHHHPITTDSHLAQRYFDQGLIFAYGFNHSEAEKVYRQDLLHYPENGWSLYGLHQSLVAQWKTEAAADAKRRGEIA